MSKNTAQPWPGFSGEMVQRIRIHDWASTPLGPIDDWPCALKIFVELMFSATQPAFIAYGPQRTFLYNDSMIPAFAAIHPHSLGRSWDDGVARLFPVTNSLIPAVMRGKTQYVLNRPFVLPNETRWFNATVMPVRDETGSVKGFYTSIAETTVPKALLESEERLRFSLNAAKAAIWQWDVANKKQVWSPESFLLHGRDPKLGPPNYDEWLQTLHPEDRRHVKAIFAEAFEKKTEEYKTDYRVLLPSGEIRWLTAIGRINYTQDGTPLHIRGINLDITERKRAEEKERKRRTELETILAAIPAVVLIAKDKACIEIEGNTAAHRLRRVPEEMTFSKSAPAKLSPHNYEVFSKGRRLLPHELPMQRAISTKAAVEGHELEFHFVEGDIRFELANALPLFDESGEVCGAVGVFTDITNLKSAELALRASEERLTMALEAANAAISEIFPDTGEVFVSSRMRELLNLPHEVPLSLETGRACLHPDDQPRFGSTLLRTFMTGEPCRSEVRLPLPDGTSRWLEFRGELRSVNGRKHVAGLFQDITDRKRAEMALLESKDLLRSIIEHAPIPIILSRQDGKILLINPAFTDLTGYTDAEIPTMGAWEALAYPREAEAFLEGQIFEKDPSTRQGVTWVRTKAGTRRLWTMKAAHAGQDAFGRDLTVSVALDITDLHNSVEEARATKSWLEAALAAMQDAVLIVGPDGRIVHCNEAFKVFHKIPSLSKVPENTAELSPIWELIKADGQTVSAEDCLFNRAIRGERGTSVEYLTKRCDGRTYSGCYNYAPILDEAGRITGAVITARDIAHRKHAEKQLRESGARLSSIIDTAADSIVVTDDKGIIQSVNRASERIFGYSQQDLVGLNINALIKQLPLDQDACSRATFDGTELRGEMEGARQNGEYLALDVATAEWGDGDGSRFFTFILHDITERKRGDEALASALRFETIGQLAGGVAHDFNNLLAVVSGNLELAEKWITDDRTLDLIRRARNAAEKGAALNRRLLSLARKRLLKPECLSLNTHASELAKLLECTLGGHIALTLSLAPNLWMTCADPAEIDSAILNIAANARDAMPKGGRITMMTSNVTLDGTEALGLNEKAKPGDYVRLRIRDTGVGMSADILNRAKAPFFTTKQPGAGTGLGLTSVANFARQTGGFVHLESEVGCGCTVDVYLPRAVENAPPANVDSPLPFGDGERVLVVEDDNEVREITLKRIEALGYSVAEARTGEEAIQRLQSGEPIELIVCDIMLEGDTTGYDIAQWSKTNCSAIGIILCTGYSYKTRPDDTARSGVDDLTILNKPYSRAQLAHALNAALLRKKSSLRRRFIDHLRTPD